MGPLDLLSGPVWQRLTWTLLHFLWQGIPDLVFGFACGEQKCSAGTDVCQHIVLFEKAGIVASHKVGAANQVWTSNKVGSKPQVRDGNGASLF